MEIKLQEDFGINIIEQQYQRYKDDVKNNVVDEDKKELQDNEGDEVITVEEMS